MKIYKKFNKALADFRNGYGEAMCYAGHGLGVEPIWIVGSYEEIIEQINNGNVKKETILALRKGGLSKSKIKKEMESRFLGY